MGETIWKKTFDTNTRKTTNANATNANANTSTNETESVYDDILRMQEKMTNINNRRNAREYNVVRENYKNIELFQNIYQKMSKMGHEDEYKDDDAGESDDDSVEGYTQFHYDEDDEDTSIGGVIEGMKSKKKKSKSKSKKKSKPKPKPPTTTSSAAKPGVPQKAEPKKTEIKNFDDLKKVIADGFGKVSIAISQFMFYVPKKTDDTLTKGTTGFAKMYSEKNASPKNVKSDANIVKNFIYQLVSFVVAIWVAFNWFFIMIHKKGGIDKCGNTTDGVGRCHPANDESRFKINFDNTGGSQTLLEFFFDFAITPLWSFDKYAMGDEYGKKLFSYIPWKIISHFIILVLSFLLVYFYDFFRVIKYTIDGKLGAANFFSMMTIGGLFFYKLYTTIRSRLDFTKGPEDTTSQVFGMILKMISPLTWFFVQFIYFAILLGIAAFSLNIGAIILVLFVWFMALFAIPYYLGVGEIWTTIKNINKYVSEDFDNDETKYRDLGIFEKILRMIAKFLHNNMYYVGFIFLMVSNLIIMNTSLHSIQLRQIMSAIIVPLIGIMLSFIWGNGEMPDTGVAGQSDELCDNLKIGTQPSRSVTPSPSPNANVTPSSNANVTPSN